jgi:RES domain-containing protein
MVVSGRWTTKGRRVVYTAETLSLAALEFLVHVDKTMLPPDLVQIEIDLPDRVAVAALEPSAIPSHWRTYPAPHALQRLGDAWLAEGSTAVLRVPSALIPEEHNVLLNPEHRDARKITVIAQREFEYDARLRMRS